jgi:hypothetical protein
MSVTIRIFLELKDTIAYARMREGVVDRLAWPHQ